MSENFDMVYMSQVGSQAEVSRDFRDVISWAKQMAGYLKQHLDWKREKKAARRWTSWGLRSSASAHLCLYRM